jgi:hypothetical protein
MNEKAFIKQVGNLISVPIYYNIDDDDNVIVDFDEIRNTFLEELDRIHFLVDKEEGGLK